MNATVSPARTPAKKAATRKGPSLNRLVHRVLSLFAALLMLWLAGTGSSIQLIDLRTRLTNVPATDPTQLSIVEGMFGPPDFAVVQVSDLSAPDLPKDLDIAQAIDVVLQAAHLATGAGNGSSGTADWVELRTIAGVPVGQVKVGKRLEAFNARSGEAVPAVFSESIPQGQRLPHSLRQKLKTLHRFWNRGDTPGVYFEFLSGLVLLTLLITGLVMYFTLLKARARINRRQWFWLSGGKWRGLHRAVSVLAAVFLLCIAFTGTFIGFESSWNALGRMMGSRRPPSPVVALTAADIRKMAATTVAAMNRVYPEASIRTLRLRTYGQMKQGVVITGESPVAQRVFNTDTGQTVSLTEPEYPKSGFPFGVQVHENIKHFHSGAMFGIPTRVMSLLSGLSLIFLALSGLVMYFDMWLTRRKGGRGSLLWK